jgi:hypothetical protein
MGNRKFVRRTRYLINPKVQLRICALVLGGALILAMMLAAVVYWRFTSGNEVYIANHPELAPVLRAETARALRIIFGFGAVAALLFALPAVLVTIFYTHRLVGPMFKTVRYLREWANDPALRPPYPLRYRKGDWFHDVAGAVNELSAALDKALPHRQAKADDQAEASSRS